MAREKGTVAVPRDYFLRMAKLDYESHTKALAREFFQNSSDAEASTIEVEVDEMNRVIKVSDDGCGMNYDIIKNKLLVLGGSEKKSGDTGAFGKAKEVLFFSWEKYEVRTQDLLVKGQGADYSIERVDDWHQGTTASIWIWKDEDLDTIRHAFEYVASRFQIFATIKVAGSIVNCDLCRGKLIQSEDWADVYHDKNKNSYYAPVRVNGQWMFEQWLGIDDIGQLVVEIKGHSLEALTSNRDGLKQAYKDKCNAFLRELSGNIQQTLNPPPKMIHEKFTGIGRVEVDQEKLAAKMKDNIQEVDQEKDVVKETSHISDAVIDMVLDTIPEENLNSIAIDRVVDTVKEVEKISGEFWTYQNRFAFIGYKPDFVVAYEASDGRDMEYILSTKKARILAEAWTEVIKQVLLDNNRYLEFTVGFDYSQYSMASYRRIEGVHYFYLNPDLLLSDLGKVKNPMSNRQLLLEDLKLKACHEIAHLSNRYHDESFIAVCDAITAHTWKSASTYKNIIRESFLIV